MSFGSLPYFVLLFATIAIHRAAAGNRVLRTAVLAAPSMDESRMRRRALPIVVP